MCNSENVPQENDIFGHLQWESMSKGPTLWDNLYGARVLGLGDTIYSRYGGNFTETVSPTMGPWFGNFM